MRIYDVGNKGRTGAWIIADSAAAAEQIAREIGHIKKSALAISDVTDHLLRHPEPETSASLRTLLASGRTGRICLRGQALTFADIQAQLLGGPAKKVAAPVWQFIGQQ
jgi:hypothetical protein